MSRSFRLMFAATLLSFTANVSAQAWPARLKDAFNHEAPRASTAPPGACGTTPVPPAHLSPALFFENIAGLDFNSAKYEAYRAEVKPIDDFKKGVAIQANGFTASRSPAYAACALTWLSAWARADALDQEGFVQTAQNERVWLLAAAATGYLQVRGEATPDQAEAIQAWLLKLSRRVSAQYGPGKPFPWANNIMAWTSYSKIVTAISLNDPALFEEGLRDARLVLRETRNGVLPREMARRERALYYHAYALAPLTYVAEMAEANGISFFAGDGAPMASIAATVANGYHDTAAFGARAGAPQQNLDKCGVNAWTVVWAQRTATPDILEASRRCGGRFFIPELGGDVGLLYGATPTSNRKRD